MLAHTCGAITHGFAPYTPPQALFEDLPELRSAFRAVVFAIFEDHNSTSDINPRGCGPPFADALGAPLLTMTQFAEALGRLPPCRP